MFLAFVSDRSVLVISNRCAESTAIAGKLKKNNRNPRELVSKRLTLFKALLQKSRSTSGRRIVIRIGGVHSISAKKRAYFLLS